MLPSFDTRATELAYDIAAGEAPKPLEKLQRLQLFLLVLCGNDRPLDFCSHLSFSVNQVVLHDLGVAAQARAAPGLPGGTLTPLKCDLELTAV